MILTDALGWALLHSIWEGAAAALLLALSMCFLRSSRARYALACGALACTVAAFGITFFHFLPAGPQLFRVAPAVRLATTGAGSGSIAFASSYLRGAQLPPWLAFAWMAGMVLFQMRAVGGWVAVSRLRRRVVCAASGTWQERLNELTCRLRIMRPVVLLESGLAEVPVVIGHFRPIILMPIGLLTGFSAAQVETILLHELAHIRRHDYLVNLLQTAAQGLLFYHPAAWWISSVIRAERENCCDDLAVAASGDAYQYALALSALAHTRGGMAMAANGGSIVKRVRRLLNEREGPRAGWVPVLIATGVVIAGMFGLAQVQAHAQPAKPAETAYTKWLDEDVVYIIQNAERQAFQRLTTDAERDHFIEQFWLRRDPTPQTVENEFKEEHYRRLMYTVQHFSTPLGSPGWKNDMGRIYILYGPADEIESHPSRSDTKPYPYQQWLYRFIEGVGQNVIIEFDDTNKTGDFRMTIDPNPPVKRR